MTTGTTVSHYRILEKLGEGGMGVVYKAEDTGLGRTVALKFLSPQFEIDEESRSRFVREAKAAAAIDHPNICTVYEIGDSPQGTFIAMALIEGQTLSEKIKERPLKLDEALDLVAQSAEGLLAAHNKRVTHRDIKSANIMVTPAGQVKIMDFGLAQLAERTKITKTGSKLGTPAYMSPEQTLGERVDHRTDIWSLGVVLYEAISGQRPFKGELEAAVAYGIVNEEPEPLTALRTGVPVELDRIISKALAKRPAERYAHTDDFLVDLRGVYRRLAREAPAPATLRLARRRVAFYGVAAALAAVAASGVLGWNLRERRIPTRDVVRFAVPLTSTQAVRPLFNNALSFSPDGAKLAFSRGGPSPILIRELSGLDFYPLPGTEGGTHPMFSPDGRWMAFRHAASRSVKKVLLAGGEPATVLENLDSFDGGGAWGPDDKIYLRTSYPGTLARFSAAGGELESVTSFQQENNELAHLVGEVLPGGSAVLFGVSQAEIESYDDGLIAVQSLRAGERKTLIKGGFAPHYSPSGHIVYARAGALLAAPFDLARLDLTGPAVKVLDGVFMSVNTAAAHFAISRKGDLAYATGVVEGGERTLVWVDRQGREQALPLPPRSYLHPRLSPDGRQLAVEIEGPVHNLFVYDFDRDVLSRISTDGKSHWPLWTPDGKRLSFRSWRTGTFTMWWMPSDRSAPEERLTEVGAMQSPVSWSPDGQALAFTQMGVGTGPDTWVLPLAGDRQPRPFNQTKFAEGSSKFSPDGRWLAYSSNESGRLEVYVQSYPGPGPKIQVSSEGGADPIWNPRGGELFYRNGDKMMAVPVTTQPSFQAFRPGLLWSAHYSHGMSSSCGPPGPTSSNYDVSADGQRFLMIRDNDQDAVSQQINVVLGWAEELKALAAAEN